MSFCANDFKKFMYVFFSSSLSAFCDNKSAYLRLSILIHYDISTTQGIRQKFIPWQWMKCHRKLKLCIFKVLHICAWTREVWICCLTKCSSHSVLCNIKPFTGSNSLLEEWKNRRPELRHNVYSRGSFETYHISQKCINSGRCYSEHE